MLTRRERIALHRQLGLSTDWLDKLTDAEYENEVWDAYEKRQKNDYARR